MNIYPSSEYKFGVSFMQMPSQIMLRKVVVAGLIILGISTLSACNRGKLVATVDDSADYKGARSLPPLKKPSRPPSPQATEASDPDTLASEQVSDGAGLSQTVDEPVSVVESTTSAAPVDVAAQVISVDGDRTRLEIETDLNSAWSFLAINLKNSDLTVFSRNKAAGRFSIGCGAIESAPAVVKRGGWSFLNRTKDQQFEHCILQAIERRGKTFVSVLNRAGAEVTSNYSSEIFTRLLNN